MIDIDKLLKSMSLKEKIGQLNLVSYDEKIEEQIKAGEIGGILNAHGRDLIKSLQKKALESPHQIPLLIGDDVIHGYKTTLPVPLAEACSFNLDLIEKSAYYSMLEARSEGINWIYAPMLDITNDPRWGRVMETSGEDPYLTSCIARRRVKGIQTPYQANITASCIKHYLGYGAVESGLDYTTSDFSEHKMRKYYLPPFKAAVKEGALSVMNAFTTYNNQPVTISSFLLKNILRDECGFDGTIVTDWQCLRHLVTYKVVQNEHEAAMVGLKVGIDIDMTSKIYHKNLMEVIKENPLLEPLLDIAVKRVLTLKAKMGLFNNPPFERIDLPDIRQHALTSADESIILFKNDNHLLPLPKEAKVLVVGVFNHDQDIHLGAWSCLGLKEKVVSLYEGIKKHFSNCSFFNLSLEIKDNDLTSLKQAVSEVDYVILALGEPRNYSGENNCRMSLNLLYNQDFWVDYLHDLHVPLIGVVFAGRPLTITILDQKAQAVLWSFHLGCEAGNSLARVLVGEVNPSAKTPITFPKELGQVPIYYNRFNIGRPELSHYMDGDINPLYPFGFGLSYSTFVYKDFEISKDHSYIEVEIENTSKISGKEIIQVYAINNYQSTLTFQKELIAFAKVDIMANETKKVKIRLNPEFELKKETTIQVGPSSVEVIQKIYYND